MFKYKKFSFKASHIAILFWTLMDLWFPAQAAPTKNDIYIHVAVVDDLQSTY